MACLLFSGFSNVYHFACVWHTALKLRCINFDMLFLVMGFLFLVDEIQFMLISSHHICIRSIDVNLVPNPFKGLLLERILYVYI